MNDFPATPPDDRVHREVGTDEAHEADESAEPAGAVEPEPVEEPEHERTPGDEADEPGDLPV